MRRLTRRLTRRRQVKKKSKHSRNNKYKKTRRGKYIKKRRSVSRRRVLRGLRGGVDDYDDKFTKFKQYDQKLIKSHQYNFFDMLKKSKFDEALCELYELYDYKIAGVENVFEIIIRHSSFQNTYHRIVFSSRPFHNTYSRLTTYETLPNRILPQFLAYILSKIGEGEYIVCEGKEKKLHFIAVNSDESDDTLIYMLQQLFDALDFVGSSHGSNTISYAMHADSIGKHQGDTAFKSLLDVLNKLKDDARIDVKTRAQIRDILTHIEVTQGDGSTVYVINTSIFNRLIKLLFGTIGDEDKQSLSDSLSSILDSSQESI